MNKFRYWSLFFKQVAFLALVTLVPVQAAQVKTLTKGSHAIGLILGNPTGLTGKVWLEPDRALDMGLSVSIDNFILIYSDYLFHFHGLFGTFTEFTQDLQPYMGVGAELSFAQKSSGVGARYTATGGTSMGIGVRIPLGAEWLLPKAPFGIFAEIVPIVELAPQSSGLLEASVGARWYF